uniref:Fucosyltransferase n=1 Tax=Palpitomonas bilix TaxID=652834 RepID=A0A7S3G316_9EUKA
MAIESRFALAMRARRNGSSSYTKPTIIAVVILLLVAQFAVFLHLKNSGNNELQSLQGILKDKDVLLSKSMEQIRKLNDEVAGLERELRQKSTAPVLGDTPNVDTKRAKIEDTKRNPDVLLPKLSHAGTSSLPWELAPPPKELLEAGQVKRKKEKVLVLAWTSHFFGQDYNKPQECSWLGKKLDCVFTEDKSKLDIADGVWFHAPSTSMGNLPPRKPPGQKWIGMSMESAANYPILENKDWMGKMDVHMTYRLDSDVPTTYPSVAEYGDFMSPPVPLSKKRTDAPAAYIQSNCLSFRDNYVKELMKHMNVHSYGRCVHNKNFDDGQAGGGGWARGGWNQAMRTRAQYKFSLAFENSISDYFVTERFFHSFAVGTVPVYMGAKNAQVFAPSNHSMIHVQDFESPKALAQYLNFLNDNDEEYEKYLSWKKEGYSESFKRVLQMNEVHSRCRLCVKIAHGCERSDKCSCGKYPDEALPLP